MPSAGVPRLGTVDLQQRSLWTREATGSPTRSSAHEIFRDAYDLVSGLARTVRGPVMSALPGKVCIDGVAEIAGESVFVLRFLQARDPSLVGRPFFAHRDPAAIWLTDLKPALGATTLSP